MRMHTDGLHAVTLVDCVAGFYASSSRDGCRGGLRLQVLPSTQFFRLHSLSAGSVDVYDAVGASFFDAVLRALPASDRTLRPTNDMAAWVADPIQRWLGDCLSAGSTMEACDDLARALGSRVADFRAAIAGAGPSQKRLAEVVDRILDKGIVVDAFAKVSLVGIELVSIEARVVIGDFKHEHNYRHRHSALGYLTPAEYAAACRCTHTPVACSIN